LYHRFLTSKDKKKRPEGRRTRVVGWFDINLASHQTLSLKTNINQQHRIGSSYCRHQRLLMLAPLRNILYVCRLSQNQPLLGV